MSVGMLNTRTGKRTGHSQDTQERKCGFNQYGRAVARGLQNNTAILVAHQSHISRVPIAKPARSGKFRI
jgi:hypothetical protein